MTAKGCTCAPDQQKIQYPTCSNGISGNNNGSSNSCGHEIQNTESPVTQAAATAATAAASTAQATVSQPQPSSRMREEESFCCKLSYADYSSIDGSRDLTTVSSSTNLQSPQHHAPTCRTGRLAERLFVDEDESDFCASCASHPKVNLVLYCFGYIGFMIFASTIFSMTEKPVELHLKSEMKQIQLDFLQRNCLDGESDVRENRLLLLHTCCSARFQTHALFSRTTAAAARDPCVQHATR